MSPCPTAKATTNMINAVLARAMKLLLWSIAHLSDRVLELTAGGRPGSGSSSPHEPTLRAAAEGFEGSICYELRRLDGAVIEGWTLRIAASAAKASLGFPTDPAVTLKLTVGDFVRFSLGAVSPVTLLTEERLRLDGDLTVAAKLAPMFGDLSLNPDPARPAPADRLRHPREMAFGRQSLLTGVAAEAMGAR